MCQLSRNATRRSLLFAVVLTGILPATHVAAARPSHSPAAPLFLAQANAAKAAEPAANAAEPPPRTEEEKKRIKSAVVLLSVLSGIALSGLLLIIAAVAIRGIQRKLAGPTRLDRDPADLLASVPQPPSSPVPPIDPAAQETSAT